MDVTLLILGKGWTGDYVIDECKRNGIDYVATTRDGRNNTVKWTFDPNELNSDYFRVLPQACVVLITFPINGKAEMKLLCDSYVNTHSLRPKWILLGSSSAFLTSSEIITRKSPVNLEIPRVQAEVELLQNHNGIVLNLVGLWGGTRHPKNWVERVAPSKEALKLKACLHLIHGEDVGRVILVALVKLNRGRWLVSDMRCYDWWDLASAYSTKASSWVQELMEETQLDHLPRPSRLVLDSREVWQTLGMMPINTLFSLN